MWGAAAVRMPPTVVYAIAETLFKGSEAPRGPQIINQRRRCTRIDNARRAGAVRRSVGRGRPLRRLIANHIPPRLLRRGASVRSLPPVSDSVSLNSLDRWGVSIKYVRKILGLFDPLPLFKLAADLYY